MNKRRFIALWPILFLTALSLMVVQFMVNNESDSTPVNEDTFAWVNNDPIGQQEMTIIAALSSHTNTSKTMEDITLSLSRIKTIQYEAVRNHLLEDSNYDYFINEWRKENLRRANALANKEVIYGPKEFTETTYYDYRQSYLYNALRKLWEDSQAELSDKLLREFYDKNRDIIARKIDSITVFEILEPLSSGLESRKIAEKRISGIQHELDEGADFIELYHAHQQNGGVAKTEIINDQNRFVTEKYRSEFFNTVMNMKQGEANGVLELNGSLAIVFIAERRNGGFKSFEETREEVKRQYLDTGFDAYISETASRTQIRFAPSFGIGQ